MNSTTTTTTTHTHTHSQRRGIGGWAPTRTHVVRPVWAETAHSRYTDIVISSLDIQPQYKYELFHIYFINTTRLSEKAQKAFVLLFIQYRQGRGLEALSAMVTEVRCETPFVMVGADTNGHSR